MAWGEAYFTFLHLTLKTFCLITRTSWCYFRKLWTIGCSNWSTILIHTFNRYWIWFAYKLLVWSEGHSSIWCNRVSSLTWNRLLFASICEGWLNCFIDWNQWITTFKCWGTCLWNTLRTCAGCASSCWSHFSHCWGISCGDFCTVLIHSFHCDWVRSTNVLLIRRKGNRAIWIDTIFAHARNCFC